MVNFAARMTLFVALNPGYMFLAPAWMASRMR